MRSNLHPPFHKRTYRARTKPEVQIPINIPDAQDESETTIEAVERRGRFLSLPAFSREAISRMPEWNIEKIVTFARNLPRLPETAQLPEELAKFTNFYIRLHEAIKGIRATSNDDDIDNLTARSILERIAREINTLAEEKHLLNLAKRYALLAQRFTIEELRARFQRPNNESKP